MDTKTKLISAAELLFDRHGFTATGMDKLTQAAGMSSRTLLRVASFTMTASKPIPEKRLGESLACKPHGSDPFIL